MNIATRNNILMSLMRKIEECDADILSANAADLGECPPDDPVIIDRLKVDNAKVAAMSDSLRRVAASADPVGRVISSHLRTDGLRIENKTVPFGTILIIYEARPDVTIEAAAIALKAGNKVLLKGGKEARRTNLLLERLWHEALIENDADPEFVRYLDISREETRDLIAGSREKFDAVIPRGGEQLIDFVLRNSKAPVIVSGRGNNFLYIDRDADIEMAIRIAVDGKSRLSVCNALDKILIDKELPDAAKSIERLVGELSAIGIEVFGDAKALELTDRILPLEDDDLWYEEFLAPKIVIGIVDNISEAISKINKYSGGHSASIVTADGEAADRFLDQVDCAAVYHNASTRFTDGGQFGLGAEIAISTQKLHSRGPLGAEHLVTNKWFVYGDGHVRN